MVGRNIGRGSRFVVSSNRLTRPSRAASILFALLATAWSADHATAAALADQFFDKDTPPSLINMYVGGTQYMQARWRIPRKPQPPT
jgi:hypothetical protein